MVLGCYLCQQPLVTKILPIPGVAANVERVPLLRPNQLSNNVRGGRLIIPRAKPQRHPFHPFRAYDGNSQLNSKLIIIDEQRHATLENLQKLKTKVYTDKGNPSRKSRGLIPTAAAGEDYKKNYEVLTSPCGHMFHRICLRNYLAFRKNPRMGSARECPFCMKPISLHNCVVTELRVPDDELLIDILYGMERNNLRTFLQLEHVTDMEIPTRTKELERIEKKVEEKEAEITALEPPPPDDVIKLENQSKEAELKNLRSQLLEIQQRNQHLTEIQGQILHMIKYSSESPETVGNNGSSTIMTLMAADGQIPTEVDSSDSTQILLFKGAKAYKSTRNARTRVVKKPVFEKHQLPNIDLLEAEEKLSDHLEEPLPIVAPKTPISSRADADSYPNEYRNDYDFNDNVSQVGAYAASVKLESSDTTEDYEPEWPESDKFDGDCQFHFDQNPPTIMESSSVSSFEPFIARTDLLAKKSSPLFIPARKPPPEAEEGLTTYQTAALGAEGCESESLIFIKRPAAKLVKNRSSLTNKVQNVK